MFTASHRLAFCLRSFVFAAAILFLASVAPRARAQSCGSWIPGPSSPDLPLNVSVNSLAAISSELYAFATDYTTPTTPRIYVLRAGLWQMLPWDDVALGQILRFTGDGGSPAALTSRNISTTATTHTIEYAVRTFNGTSWVVAAAMQQTLPTNQSLSFGDFTIYNGAWYLCTTNPASSSLYRSSGTTLSLLASTDTVTASCTFLGCFYLDPRSLLTLQVGLDGLYLGGRFESITAVGGSTVTAKNLVRFNGTAFVALASQPSATVRGMLLDNSITINNTGLVIWGDFSQVGTLSAACIARYNSFTGAWNALGAGLNGSPAAVVQVQGVTLNSINYVAVYATPVGVANTWGCAKWTGSGWQNFGGSDATTALGNPGSFTSAVNFSGIIVGGSALNVNNVPRYGVSRWSGTSWDFVAAQSGTDGLSRAVTNHNSSIYVGGDFSHIDSVLASHVARYNPTTDTYEPLGSGSGGVNGPVSALTSFGGELIAGGSFTTAGGIAASNVAAWNGTQWRALGNGLDGTVRGFTTWNGSLVAVGSFRNSGATAVGSAARWTGTAWVAIDATFTSADLYAASTLNTTLYVGGPTGFRRFNGTAFEVVGNNVAETVYTLCPVFGSMYVGGDFPTVGSPALGYKRIARWSGTAWFAVGPNANFDFASGSVRSIFASADEVFAAGDFQVLISSSATATNIARFDGTQWRRLDPEAPNARVLAGTLLGTRVWAAGEFTYVGPSASPVESYGVAQWSKAPVFITNPLPQPVCLTNGSGVAAFSVQTLGTPAPALRWHKNGAPMSDNLRISGTATATLAINGVISTDAATYSCLATDTCAGTTFSTGALLTFGCCTADFDGSGGLSVNDIFAFLNAWFAGNPTADFNHANGITAQDIFDFLGAWFAGC